MSPFLPWVISIAGLVLLWLWIAYRSGPHAAMGITVLVATLIPTWSVCEIAGLNVYVRDIASLICLGLYCFHPRSTYPIRLGILDCLMLVWLTLHIISDGRNDSWSWTLFVRAYAEWGVPYIAARLAFSDEDAVEKMMPWGAGVAAFLGLYAIGESLTGLHPYEWIFDHRPDENFARDSVRWGLRRPWGPTAHAIYFGFVQVILAPWAWMMTVRAYRAKASFVWIGAAALSTAGIFFSVSRAPLMGIVLLLLVALAILIKQSRIPLGIAMGLVLIAGVIKHEEVIRWLEQSGESSTNARKGQMIMVDGKQVEYSGTMTRVYLFSIYKRAISVAGFTGFGTQRTSVFPPRIPMGAEDQKTWELVRFVDNSYVLMTLRFGWLAGILLATLGVMTTFTWARLAHVARETDVKVMAAMLAGTMVASMFVLFTVWLAHDFSYLIFWLFGTASGTVPRDYRPKVISRRERR